MSPAAGPEPERQPRRGEERQTAKEENQAALPGVEGFEDVCRLAPAGVIAQASVAGPRGERGGAGHRVVGPAQRLLAGAIEVERRLHAGLGQLIVGGEELGWLLRRGEPAVLGARLLQQCLCPVVVVVFQRRLRL